MKIEIKLSANTKLPDVVALNEYIREHNIKGVISTVEEAEPTQGSMSFDDYLPAIKLVLGSTATVGGIKGIFDIIKSYFDLVKQKYVSKAETDKENLKQSKVEFTFEESGKKVTLNFSSFDETERKSFFETVNKVLEKDA
ncbi:hypothetical protein IC229_22410 [Spirosoma sp. BT702]|uniref:Uncharacterized protein n=1 Tax=Spirosoma profusum TaxID=2771354 RepID=A0A926XYQ5_9BACT|nr:hypothetical protein [Spirosoma profusum]MBD2703414.1 hypothetical protein [Spirosoma profusum]